MRTIRNKFVFIAFLASIFTLSCISYTAASAELSLLTADTPISMDFKDVNLKDLLKVFSIQSGLNFIASQAVQERRITLYFDKVPVKEAMDQLFKANNLTYEYDVLSNTIIVKDWGIPQIETVTEVFYLKYASVSSSSLKKESASQLGTSATGTGASSMITSAGGIGGGTEDSGITSAIKKILSENGQIIEDPRTNSLVVTDIPSRMPIITKTIAALDIPQLQVMLEVEMLDVSKNAVDKIGLKFGNSSSPSIMTMVLTGAKRTTMFPFSAWAGGDFDKSGRAGNAGNITAGNIDFSTATYTVLLDFFKSLSDTKYLARPRILTLNNETAEIKITTQETVGVTSSVSSGAGGITTGTGNTADRVETGVSLRVTPQINPDTAEITMFIMPSVKDTSTSSFINSGTTYFKDPEERSTRTTVRIKDGETVIIGGLIRNDSSETTTKVPFLGDIPVLGALFRHKNKEKDKERELLVFITPHIIKESPIELAKTNNLPERNLLLEREQQPSESLIERKQSINTSLSKFER